jgi:hypothetical protein
VNLRLFLTPKTTITVTRTWLQDLNSINQQYVNSFQHLNAEELNWKPTPEKWSVGQCVDHIITTNSTYFAIFEGILNNTHTPTFFERLPFWPSLVGKMLLNSIKPASTRAVRTFPVFEPATSDIPSDILARLAANNTTLGEYISRLKDYDHEKIIITSPVNKYLTYSLSTAINIVIAHEERHFNQAKRVLDMLQQQ